MPSRSIIRTGVGPHREPGNRFPAMAAINLLAARAARVQSRRNLSRSLSPKLDHSHSITRFDRSRTGAKRRKDRGAVTLSVRTPPPSGLPRPPLSSELAPRRHRAIYDHPAPSTWGGAWRGRPGRVGGRHDIRGQVPLRRLPFSGRGHQPRRVALLPLPARACAWSKRCWRPAAST